MNDKDAKNAKAGLDEFAILNMWRLLKLVEEEDQSETIYLMRIHPDTTGALERFDFEKKCWIKVFFWSNFTEALDKFGSYLSGLIKGYEHV